MTDPNTAVLRALGLPEKLGHGIESVVIRLEPGKLPVAEMSVIVDATQESANAEIQFFNIVPIEDTP